MPNRVPCNLLTLTDLGRPYGPLPDGRVMDSKEPPKPHTVEMAYHHVVPKLLLSTLWRDTVTPDKKTGDDVMGKSQKFMESLKGNVKFYTEIWKGSGGEMDLRDLPSLETLVGQIGNAAIKHDAGERSPRGWDDFWRIFLWLPANLFVGPKDRSDDPGPLFDEKADNIVEANRFAALRKINDKILAFRKSCADPVAAEEAWDAMEVISPFGTVTHFDSDQWGWDETVNKPLIKG
jgi:hypothetical protein